MALGFKSRVATETYVERELIAETATTRTYAFRMVWEGTVLASTEVTVARGATLADIDSAGSTWLLRALATV
jgi:hypothetical protein